MNKLKNLYIKLNRVLRSKYYSFSKQRIFVFGDSHAKVFSFINNENLLPEVYFDVLSIGGATAMGVVNPNSKTNAFKYFKQKLYFVPKNESILVLLGEVDTGFVIWFRAQKYGLSVESQLEQALENYDVFISMLLKKGYSKIALISAPLPTIKDNSAEFGEIARLRKVVTSSQDERTELTLKFNKKLSILAKERGVRFINLDPHLLGIDGMINPIYLNSDPLNHHCDHQKYSSPIIEELRKEKIIGFEGS